MSFSFIFLTTSILIYSNRKDTMTEFQDLPYELVETIASYLDNYTLSKLQDYPKIGDIVLRTLYSTVTIEDSDYSLIALDPLYEIHKSSINSPSAYLDLLKSKPSIIVKNLIIRNPFDVFELIDKCPECLKGVKIQLIFDQLKMYKSNTAQFLKKYKNNPFSFDSIEVGFPIFTDDPLPWFEVSQNVTSLHAFNDRLERNISETFPSLTSLRLDRIIKPQDLRFLPQQLINFHCNLEPIEMHTTELELPDTLQTLFLNLSVEDENAEKKYVLDISETYNLKTLELYSHYCLSRVVFNLPGSIINIQVEQVNMMFVKNLASMCPKLTTLQFKGRLTRKPHYYDPLWSFPKSLRHLILPSTYLRNSWLVKKQTFPSELTELGIRGERNSYEIFWIDFETTKFDKLSILHISEVPLLNIIGSIPQTITKLTLNKVPTNILQYLKDLVNLSELHISGEQYTNEFIYTLPDSLTELTMLFCSLLRVIIWNPLKLVRVKLCGNNFKILGYNVMLPNGIETLYLSHNKISEISPGFKFPKRLQFLDLSYNKLTEVVQFPDNLKQLVLDKNLLGKSNSISTIPTQLEFLSLGCNQISPTWIDKLCLTDCIKLKYLNLNENPLGFLDLKNFPRSLEELALSRCQISSINGSFAKFENLRELDLSYNKFDDFISNLHEYQGKLFSDAIQIVDVKGNQLAAKDAKVLFDELTIKPNFQRLYIEENILSESMDTSLLKPRKIRKLNR